MSRSKSDLSRVIIWQVLEVWVLQTQAFGVFDDQTERFFAELAGLCHHSQAGWCQIFIHPWEYFSMSSCRFRQWNTPSHGILITRVHQFFRWAFAYDMIWWSFSYICCADLMKNNPEIKKIQVLRVLFWCGDKYDTLGHIRAGRVYGKETVLA